MADKINFKDFNFKLAVVQVLMYEKELLKPKFDIHEFAANHKGRKIDIEEEGYDIIPEAQQYFEALEIPKELLAEVTEIEQGGNEIHHQLCPFWDGEDDIFNITSTADIALVPNLRKAVIFYDFEEEMVDAFERNGVTAEYL